MSETDPYPWGTQLPVKRTADLRRQLTALEKKRDATIEAHRKALASFEDQERLLKADLKVASGFAEKHLREQAAQSVAKTVEKLLLSGKIAPGVVNDPAALEAALVTALATNKAPGAKPHKAKAG